MNLSNLAPDYIGAIAPYQGGKPISEITDCHREAETAKAHRG